MNEIKIEMIPVGQLKPAEYNPRTISEDMLSRLKRGISEFGFLDPLVINNDMTVIGGHQRLKAIEGVEGFEAVPCVRVDVSKQKEKALNLALNKISGEWHVDKLGTLLNEIKTFDEIDIDLTGFDKLDFGDMFPDGGSGFDNNGFGESGSPENNNDLNLEDSYKEQYGIIITCDDSAQQEQYFNKLIEDGYDCKVVVT